MNWTVFLNVFFIPLFCYAALLTVAAFAKEIGLNAKGQDERGKTAGYFTVLMLAIVSLFLFAVVAANNWPTN